jgi:hypothetical protein
MDVLCLDILDTGIRRRVPGTIEIRRCDAILTAQLYCMEATGLDPSPAVFSVTSALAEASLIDRELSRDVSGVWSWGDMSRGSVSRRGWSSFMPRIISHRGRHWRRSTPRHENIDDCADDVGIKLL